MEVAKPELHFLYPNRSRAMATFDAGKCHIQMVAFFIGASKPAGLSEYHQLSSRAGPLISADVCALSLANGDRILIVATHLDDSPRNRCFQMVACG